MSNLEPHTIVRRGWGSVIVRNDTGVAEAVYRARLPWVASYAARNQYRGGFGPRTWEEYLVGVGLTVASLFLAPLLSIYTALIVLIASVTGVAAARSIAGRASTARVLQAGKAITKLVVSGNDDLIEAAIDPVLAFDADPKGAAGLVNELRDAWRAAEASTANEKDSILAALRTTAENFPDTDAGVARSGANSPA